MCFMLMQIIGSLAFNITFPMIQSNGKKIIPDHSVIFVSHAKEGNSPALGKNSTEIQKFMHFTPSAASFNDPSPEYNASINKVRVKSFWIIPWMTESERASQRMRNSTIYFTVLDTKTA